VSPTDARLATGRRAEALAAAFLERQGMRILARNWRQPGGEIDLVADDGGACVFVEVRARTGLDFGHPLEAVGPVKRAQIVRAARLYLHLETPAASGYRFDVIGVLFSPAGDEPQLFHVPDAFRIGE
jgi:putative endonuclease